MLYFFIHVRITNIGTEGQVHSWNDGFITMFCTAKTDRNFCLFPYVCSQLFLLEELRERKFDGYARRIQKAYRMYKSRQYFLELKQQGMPETRRSKLNLRLPCVARNAHHLSLVGLLSFHRSCCIIRLLYDSDLMKKR